MFFVLCGQGSVQGPGGPKVRFAITWRSEARDRSGVFVERYQKPENGILADKVMSGHRGTRSADKVSGQR